ncbi:hypothetical protein [Sulfitobacter pontiacus]|uniref:hypothetical protein n=1 Tax=Sulfitobacter pontiacus TaxID=60137 RepID=UPI0012697684|nr:hypothetical protein [Sulfitobacter pontiacus]
MNKATAIRRFDLFNENGGKGAKMCKLRHKGAFDRKISKKPPYFRRCPYLGLAAWWFAIQ